MKWLAYVAGSNPVSRSPYGERGLKLDAWTPSQIVQRRSPYGERGLKSYEALHNLVFRWSLSLRRAWIEIERFASAGHASMGRSPYGERGLKCEWVKAGALALMVALLTESVD